MSVVRYVVIAGWVVPLAATLYICDSYWNAEVLPKINGVTAMNSFDFVRGIRLGAAITVLWMTASALTVATLVRPQ